MFYLLAKGFSSLSPPSKLKITVFSVLSTKRQFRSVLNCVLSDFHPMANDDYVT